MPQDQSTGETTVSKPAKAIDKIINVLLVCAIAVLIVVVLLRVFVISGVRIEQTSMSPTYQSGDKVWVKKTGEVRRGDVVVFYKNQVGFWQRIADGFLAQDGDNKKLIKRVVALGGDKLWVEPSGDGYVVKIQTEDGIFTENYDGVTIPLMYDTPTAKVRTTLGVLKNTSSDCPYVVAPNSMFVMGDNRYDSVDSRDFGAISLDNVFGIVK